MNIDSILKKIKRSLDDFTAPLKVPDPDLSGSISDSASPTPLPAPTAPSTQKRVLSAGAKVCLNDIEPQLESIFLNLSWRSQVNADLDLSVFMLNKEGKAASERHVIFYGQRDSVCKSVRHKGDNVISFDNYSAEIIEIEFSRINTREIARIAICATINEEDGKFIGFNSVEEPYLRIMKKENDEEILRFYINEKSDVKNAVFIGELYVVESKWCFKALDGSNRDGLGGMCKIFGIATC